MDIVTQTSRPSRRAEPPRSLYHLLDPDILADPYPLYRDLREHAPVMWDPFLHAWVVTGYADVVSVLQSFSAARTPGPEQLRAIGLGGLEPIAEIMIRQMLFMDPPAHTSLRGLCASAFLPRQVERMRPHIQQIAGSLVDRVIAAGSCDLIADFAAPLPAIVTAELLGLPPSDHPQLKAWSADFAEMLGNFQHNPDRIVGVIRSVHDMVRYFRSALRQSSCSSNRGLMQTLLESGTVGARLTEEEVIANAIVVMVGGQETTTNLIGNGMLTLLRQPARLQELRTQPDIIPEAVEELLRYESPSQHTARLAPDDITLGGKRLRKRDAVMAVIGAANRDPLRFAEPDRLDLRRTDNRHLAFGWGSHFCFGAPLARLEGRIAFETLLRLSNMELEPGALEWRENLGLRGLKALRIRFGPMQTDPAKSGT